MFFEAFIVVLLAFMIFLVNLFATKGLSAMRKLLTLSVFICICLIRVFAQDVDSLLVQARDMVDQDRSVEAAQLYQMVLEKDSANYESNAFMGNYYYLLGKNASSKSDAAYLAIAVPNRMQMARYQDEMKRIYRDFYDKSDRYLQRALNIHQNDHLQKLYVAVQALKVKAGLVPILSKRKK